MNEMAQPTLSMRSFQFFAKDIKLAHSVFALPFAASAFIVGGLAMPSALQLSLLLVCMVTARSFAMGMNRFLDAEIDKENPRTAMRMIPAGRLSKSQSLAWCIVAAVIFVASAAGLSTLAGLLAVPLLLVLAFYSRMKKISWLTHWYLGACLGMAPIGVEIALTGVASRPVLLLGFAMMFWTAGFDILYALQDMRFDRDRGLKSIPAKVGPTASLVISKFCFGVTLVSLLVVGGWIFAGMAYYVGVAIVGAILAFEHFLVFDARFDGRSKNIGAAFFNANAAVSIIYFAALLIDRWEFL